jgi:hypothetical protein
MNSPTGKRLKELAPCQVRSRKGDPRPPGETINLQDLQRSGGRDRRIPWGNVATPYAFETGSFDELSYYRFFVSSGEAINPQDLQRSGVRLAFEPAKTKITIRILSAPLDASL